MAETHVISALTSKRSELAGVVAFHSKEIARIAEEVKALDATIKLFEPEYRINSIKPKRYQRKNQFFKHGEAHKLILDILRDAKAPISTLVIAAEAQRRKGLVIDDKAPAAFKASIGGVLARQRTLGLITEVGKDKGASVWAVA
jgi:hypothetical protein